MQTWQVAITTEAVSEHQPSDTSSVTNLVSLEPIAMLVLSDCN